MIASGMCEVKEELIGQLQETLLKALLLNQPLPGSTKPIVFPDLSLILRQSTIPLIDENLAKSICVAALAKPVRVLSLDDLLEEARAQGNLAYLRFQPAERLSFDVVRVTLQAGLAPDDPDQHTMGLSGIQVKFQKVADQWRAIDEPVFFAT
jgi:hypothetical protein